MTVLIIVGALLLIIMIACLLPVSLYFRLDGEFFFKVRVAGIKVFALKPEQDEKKPPPPDTESDRAAEKEEKNLFNKLRERLGFTGAVKELIGFASDLLKKIKNHLKHTAVKQLKLDITVATDDAAKTALEYGAVCTAVYPVLTFIGSFAKVKLKNINIKSDFDSQTPEFKFSAVVRLSVIRCIMAAFGIFSEYNEFKIRNNLV